MAGCYPLNQLQFQVGATPSNMAFKFRPPQPLIVEKFRTGTQTPLEMSRASARGPVLHQKLKPAFEFSTISEDRMLLAMRMARKDLQKQKQQARVDVKAEQLPKRIIKKPKGCLYPSASRKGEKRKDKLLGVKKTDKKTDVKQKSRPTMPMQGIVHMSTRPAAPISPPVRDSDPYAPIKDRGQDSRMMDEIMRLRNEMHTCMSQIQQIEDTVHKGGSVPKPKPLPGTEDLPLEEQARRREARAEESATRTSRTLYALRQQVRHIQGELKHADPLTGQKKSKFLTRLAAAHRAAVRSLQAFVTQLADMDLTQGLPRAYREFALLVRQLSLCCAQLEIAGESAVPESVTKLLQDMADMNEGMEEELRDPHCETGIPPPAPRGCHTYWDQPPALSVQGAATVQGAAAGKENRRGKEGSPERQSALKRGIEVLMHAAGPETITPGGGRHCSPPPDVPHLSITPRTPRVPPTRPASPPLPHPHVAWEVPVSGGYRHGHGYEHGHGHGHGREHASQRQKKSYLLPSALQARRERVSRPVAIPGPSHYAEPTMSTRLKKVLPSQLPQTETYPPQPRSPSPTPRSPRVARRVLLPDAPPTFAEPTLASALKAVMPSEHGETEDKLVPFLPTSRSPRWGDLSPRRDSSPRRECEHWRENNPRREYLPSVRSPRTPRRGACSILPTATSGRSTNVFNTACKEIARQVFIDRDSAKRMRDIDELKRTEKARLVKLRSNLNETDELVRETEQRIRQKIQPLIQDAQEVADRYAELRRTTGGPLREDLARTAVNTVECNADVLADMILHDVLEETVIDLQEMEDDETAEQVAWHMTQAPSIANLIQRLQEMEVEQDQIRQRWATIVYEDELGPQRASYHDAAGCDRPGTPPPILLTCQDPEVERQLTPTRTRLMHVPHPHEDEDTELSGLYFTRSPLRFATRETLHLSTRHLGTSGRARSPGLHVLRGGSSKVKLSVERASLESIRGYVGRYEAHLKRTVANPIGNFNPWHVINELSDAILSECLESVAKELEEINNDVVNHVYQAEFKQLPDEP